MRKNRRPWWLVVNKSARLVTTIQEEANPGERVFIIRGEPLIQSLAWLIWGPGGALAMICVLTWLAISLNAREQAGSVRILFIMAYLSLPVLIWGILGLVFRCLSQKHLQAERQAEVRESVIRLSFWQGELGYKTANNPMEKRIAFNTIQGVRVAPPVGGRDVRVLRLLLETDAGPVILLDEGLGTPAQKNDLAQEIRQTIENYANRQNN